MWKSVRDEQQRKKLQQKNEDEHAHVKFDFSSPVCI